MSSLHYFTAAGRQLDHVYEYDAPAHYAERASMLYPGMWVQWTGDGGAVRWFRCGRAVDAPTWNKKAPRP